MSTYEAYHAIKDGRFDLFILNFFTREAVALGFFKPDRHIPEYWS